MEAKYSRDPELNDNLHVPVKSSHHKEHYDPNNPELCDGPNHYKGINKGKKYDASKYNDFHELQADFKELRVKGSKNKQRRKKRKKMPKLNFEGEKFKDPDPYQLAVRKTQYGKEKGKFVFEGEKFKDPDPFELAIRKQSSSSGQSDKDVRYEFGNQLHHAHPGEVHGRTEYYNRNAYIGGMDEDDDDESFEDEADPWLNRSALAQFLAVGVKNVLLLGYGMTLGFPTIVIPAIQGGDGRGPSFEKDFILSKEEISWLSSINLICVPLGCIFSGMLTQPIGRRRAMQIVNVPILIAWLLFHYASDVHFLYCGLALAGFSGGLSEAPVLTYVAEITQPRYRGMLAATGSTCVIIGVLIQFLMGSFLRWRTVALISACLPVISFLLLFLVPESPVWLAGKGRHSQAQKALAWLRGWVSEEEVLIEYYGIQKHMQETAEEEKDYTVVKKIKQYGTRPFLQPFGIISLCFFIGHFSGMTTLQTYAVQIFHTLKAPIDKYYATVLLGVAELLGTLFCVFLVHFSGKRPLVFISTIGCAICFFTVASYAYFLNSIPGSSFNNVVANVSAIKTDVRVIPLNHSEILTVLPEDRLAALVQNFTLSMNESSGMDYNTSAGVTYDDQNFTPYYLNGSYDDTLNNSIRYGEYVKSAIPRDVLVQIPNANENKYLWLPLTLLLGSAFLTHMGIRLIPWMLIGELFAPSIRSGASGLAGGTGYIFGFLANKLFLKMLGTFTLPGTFWTYSAITIIGAIILYKVLPETEGKTLVEIEHYFASKRKQSIRLGDIESLPPKPKPRGFATAFSPPPPLPPRPHPLKDDLGRVRKLSQVGAQSRKSSTNTPPRKLSEGSGKTGDTHRKISTTSTKGSVHSYTVTSSRPSQSSMEHYRKISASKISPPLPPISASPEPIRKINTPQSKTIAITKTLSDTTPPMVQHYRKISDSHPASLHPPVMAVSPQVPQQESKIKPEPKKRSSSPKPPSMLNFDIKNWESNKKFEELLRRREHQMRPVVNEDDLIERLENTTAPSTTSQHDLKRFAEQEEKRDAHLLAVGMRRHRQNSGSLNALTDILGHDNRGFVSSRTNTNDTKM